MADPRADSGARRYEQPDNLQGDCPKGGKHRVKFNSGNPACIKCGTFKFSDGGTVKLPASVTDDGEVIVHDPLRPHDSH